MSIFVSLASYRDRDCRETLQNLYATAAAPEMVYVGVCEQNHPSETAETCVVSQGIPERNVRRIALHHGDARGPCWARYLCSTLYQDEEYYLQIDSHMRFVKDWDKKLVEMLAAIEKSSGSSRIVLSTYVRSVDDYDHANMTSTDPGVPQICQAFWNENGMVSLHGAAILEPTREAK